MNEAKPDPDAIGNAAQGTPVHDASGEAPAADRRKDNNAAWDADDEGDEWRHPPVAPKDEGVLDSLGRSVSEAIVGADADGAQDKPKTPGRD